VLPVAMHGHDPSQRQMCKALLLLTVGGLVLSRRANLGLKKRNSAARPSKIDIFYSAYVMAAQIVIN
jgi:hypothetical protein